jgi:hypothetical protein
MLKLEAFLKGTRSSHESMDVLLKLLRHEASNKNTMRVNTPTSPPGLIFASSVLRVSVLHRALHLLCLGLFASLLELRIKTNTSEHTSQAASINQFLNTTHTMPARSQRETPNTSPKKIPTQQAQLAIVPKAQQAHLPRPAQTIPTP